MSAADAATARFTTPGALAEVTTLGFTVSDDAGLSHQDQVSVTVITAAAALTARVEALPEQHYGATEFTFELHFSEEISISYVTVRDDVFEVTGGEIRSVRRRVRGSNLSWIITVRPTADADVVLALPSGRACDSTGAICTAGGKRFSERLEATVKGPVAP